MAPNFLLPIRLQQSMMIKTGFSLSVSFLSFLTDPDKALPATRMTTHHLLEKLVQISIQQKHFKQIDLDVSRSNYFETNW